MFLESLLNKIHEKSIQGTPKVLDPKFAKIIFDNWKYRDEMSLTWIENQCEQGTRFY